MCAIILWRHLDRQDSYQGRLGERRHLRGSHVQAFGLESYQQ